MSLEYMYSTFTYPLTSLLAHVTTYSTFVYYLYITSSLPNFTKFLHMPLPRFQKWGGPGHPCHPASNGPDMKYSYKAEYRLPG